LINGSAVSTALALVLGLRHGLDADHLCAIDGLTRWNLMRERGCARFCGALFSAGHGAVILTAALLLAGLVHHWNPPGWLAPLGAAVSATVLIVLSTLNFRTAFSRRVGPVGIRSRICGRLLQTTSGWQVALVGGLFALSFDAFSLAALFAATATPASGALGAGLLAATFAAGMIAVDAVNGLWVYRLLQRSDEAGQSAGRLMTLSVAGVGVVVGVTVCVSTLYEPLEQWLTGHELAASSAVVGTILLSYLATLLSRSAAVRS
jgi:high-affinity nickel-transport protein